MYTEASMRTSRANGTRDNVHHGRIRVAACLVIAAPAWALACADGGTGDGPDGISPPTAEWTYYGGQNSFNRYSPPRADRPGQRRLGRDPVAPAGV